MILKKERILLTKKDFTLSNEIVEQDSDYEMCYNNGELTIFPDFENTVSFYENQNCKYLGIEKL